jgi:hypothetical protein
MAMTAALARAGLLAGLHLTSQDRARIAAATMHDQDRSQASALIDSHDGNATLYRPTGSHFLNNKKQSRVEAR